MPTYLLALSIGPVQSMIEAARRTRDLWGGSWLLAEAAKAAALALHRAQAGSLVFPAPVDPETALAPSTLSDEDAGNIANVLRVQIEAPSDEALGALVGTTKAATCARLRQLCDSAYRKVSSLPFREDLWSAQVDDILEFFAAWVKIDAEDYRGAALRLGGLMAARKATRDFVPAAIAPDGLGVGVAKSSLDGARESVLGLARADREKAHYKDSLRKLGLSAGEELDALAVAKRMAGSVEQFTPYSRITADAWIEAIARDRPAGLDALRKAYAPLVEMGLATRVTGNGGIYKALPFDAQLLFAFRLDNALANAASDEERHALRTLREAKRGLEEPVPYAAILKADGDRMGELLSRATSAQQSRLISRALQEFSDTVRGVVRTHRGHAIYAGGDDMLALLPLEAAVQCAADLAATFKQAMDGVAATLGLAPELRPTLSVGLGVGHLMEPLGRLRARADDAEKMAKGNHTGRPRNALAVHLGIRSGATIGWRCRWDEDIAPGPMGSGVQALQYFSKMSRNDQCPSRLGYELREVAQRLSWAQTKAEVLPGIHAAELARTLADAHLRGGHAQISVDLRQRLTDRAHGVGLRQLADELIVARWLAARTVSDLGVME